MVENQKSKGKSQKKQLILQPHFLLSSPPDPLPFLFPWPLFSSPFSSSFAFLLFTFHFLISPPAVPRPCAGG
jgi:hypothetical protein